MLDKTDGQALPHLFLAHGRQLRKMTPVIARHSAGIEGTVKAVQAELDNARKS